MVYRVLADILVILHFAWILFMLAGFFITVLAFRMKHLFELCVFRTVHVLGIVYISVLAAMGRYCPLTVWENALRRRYSPSTVYPGSFIARYIERLVYPGVDPIVIVVPTVLIGLFTAAVFLVRPPGKIKKAIIRVLGKVTGR